MFRVLELLKRLETFSDSPNRYVLLFSDLAEFQPLIEGFFRTRNGAFVDVSRSQTKFQGSLTAKETEMISLSSKQLNIIGSNGPGSAYFEIIVEGSESSLRLMVEENGAVSPGKQLEDDSQDRASLLASIITLPIVAGSEFPGPIGVLYDLDTLDPVNIGKLNEYFSTQMIALTPGRKVVVFLRTRTLDLSYFQEPIRLIGAINEKEFISIKPAYQVDQTISVWSSTWKREDPIVLFLGAGCSTESGIPMGDTLLRRSLEDLLNQRDRTDDELVELFWEHVRINNHWLDNEDKSSLLRFERVILEQIKQFDYPESPTIQYLADKCRQSSPSPAHLGLATMIEKGFRFVVVTPNYDQLIENALRASGADPLVVAEESEANEAVEAVRKYLSGDSDRIPILKVHGTIDRLDTLAASVEDTRVLKEGIKDLLRIILSKREHKDLGLKERLKVVFAGYSFRDEDLMKVLEERDNLEGMDEWVIDPLPKANVLKFLQKDALESIRVDQTQRIISTTFGLFMGKLIQGLP